MDVLVSCAETDDSCHTFNIFLFALVKTFKQEYTTKWIHIGEKYLYTDFSYDFFSHL